MKRGFFTALLIFLLLPGVHAAADFYVTDLSPRELTPGETTTMTISLRNLALDYALYVRAELDPDDVSPITAIGTSKRTVDRAEAAEESNFFGIVTQRDTVDITYEVRADEDTAIGTYNVPLMLTWQEATGLTKTQTLYLGVDITGEPKLAISGITLDPARVYPDSEFTLTLQMENIGDDKAKVVECDIQLPDAFSGEDMAFLGTIDKGSKATATYSLKALKTAQKDRAYEFNAVITYEDLEGPKTVEKPFKVFVSERGEIDLEIAGVSTSPAKIYPGTDFTLSVQLENIGTQDAKSVMASITDTQGFVGEFSSFIGKIESDDVSSGIFDLTATPVIVSGDHTFTMEVLFTDEKGEEFSATKTFTVYVDEKQESSPVGIGIVVLVIAVVGIVLWRRRRAAQMAEI